MMTVEELDQIKVRIVQRVRERFEGANRVLVTSRAAQT